MLPRSWTVAILLVSLASIARAGEPVDASAEADLPGERGGHVVVADPTRALDPATACEAASENRSTTRPAQRHVEFHEKKSTSSEAAPVADVTEPPPKSLAARQGLLVPAAFLAAASALSSTIVLSSRSRAAKTSAAPHEAAPQKPAPADHSPGEPAAH